MGVPRQHIRSYLSSTVVLPRGQVIGTYINLVMFLMWRKLLSCTLVSRHSRYQCVQWPPIRER